MCGSGYLAHILRFYDSDSSFGNTFKKKHVFGFGNVWNSVEYFLLELLWERSILKLVRVLSY